MDLEIGQVLALKIRFNNSGAIAQNPHPYLIVGVDEKLDILEIVQVDSLQGKEYKATFKTNKVIYCDEPDETVIDKDSYVQLDNKFTLDCFPDLVRFRRQRDKLSEAKLKSVIETYRKYHLEHHLDEMKIVHLCEAEIRQLNK